MTSCLRFLNEDPWERLRTFKKMFKNTRLLMLLRGQNLLGYRHYPDDVVEAFVRAAIKNGIDDADFRRTQRRQEHGKSH